MRGGAARLLQRATTRTLGSTTMALADAADAIEFLGRFVIFWTFVFKRSYRRSVIRDWKAASGFIKVMSALDGMVTAVVGSLPLALIGAGAWWLS